MILKRLLLCQIVDVKDIELNLKVSFNIDSEYSNIVGVLLQMRRHGLPQELPQHGPGQHHMQWTKRQNLRRYKK